MRFCVLLQQIKDLIRQEHRMDHSKDDAFVLFIMSHGEKGIILGNDDKGVNIDDDIIRVLGECQSLWNKPKMLFFQACRSMRNSLFTWLVKCILLSDMKCELTTSVHH